MLLAAYTTQILSLTQAHWAQPYLVLDSIPQIKLSSGPGYIINLFTIYCEQNY